MSHLVTLKLKPIRTLHKRANGKLLLHIVLYLSRCNSISIWCGCHSCFVFLPIRHEHFGSLHIHVWLQASRTTYQINKNGVQYSFSNSMPWVLLGGTLCVVSVEIPQCRPASQMIHST